MQAEVIQLSEPDIAEARTCSGADLQVESSPGSRRGPPVGRVDAEFWPADYKRMTLERSRWRSGEMADRYMAKPIGESICRPRLATLL